MAVRGHGWRRLPLELAAVVGLLLAAAHAAGAPAQDDSSPRRIVAYVGERPIRIADVDWVLGRRAGGTAVAEALPAATLQTTLQLIAYQWQALATLREQGLAASQADVERWILAQVPPGAAQPANSLSGGPTPASGSTPTAAERVAELARQAKIDPETHLDLIAFRLSWQRYLQQHLTDTNLEKHFRNQTARFDGTEFLTAMVSVAVPAGESIQREQAARQLSAIKEAAESQEQTLTEAAAAAPDVEVRQAAWVRGTGDLDPRLVNELLKLEPNQLSQPLHTATGVHLLELRAVKAGSLQLDAVRDEVRAHMLIYLLEYLADKSRAKLPFRAAPEGAGLGAP